MASWMEQLRQAGGAPPDQERGLSWYEVLQRAKAQARNGEAEPWRLPLERLRGTIGDGGIERITTQAIFDILEIRNAAAALARRADSQNS
jgi:hypothetical protein